MTDWGGKNQVARNIALEGRGDGMGPNAGAEAICREVSHLNQKELNAAGR